MKTFWRFAKYLCSILNIRIRVNSNIVLVDWHTRDIQ